MVDWTYSIIRDASMLQDRYTSKMGPPKEPTTTMLKLDLSTGVYTRPLAEVSGNEITDTTAEGRALLSFLTQIAKEPGHASLMWGRVHERENQIVIFVGKA